MTITISSRTRAGMLVVAMALVGGTGCITMSIVDHVEKQNRIRQMTEARDRRIRQLTPAADAGDRVAQRTLAFVLLAPVDGGPPPDVPRILSLFERASAQGDLAAQVTLARMLVTGRSPVDIWSPTRPVIPADHARGLALMQQAATKACQIQVLNDPQAETYGWRYHRLVSPAADASRFLAESRRNDEGRLWKARDILHCDGETSQLEYMASHAGNPRQRREALGLLLLGGDRNRIAHAEGTLTPQEVAAAESDAAELRRQVVESERDFPAPKLQEWQ